LTTDEPLIMRAFMWGWLTHDHPSPT
jgi:hypothetical protein